MRSLGDRIWHFPGKLWAGMMKAAGLRTWAIIGAAVAMTAFAGWHTWIVWKGPWPAAAFKVQLDIIAWGLWGALIIIFVIVVALTGISVTAALNKSGLNLNVGDEEHPAPPIPVQIEGNLRVDPPAPPAKPQPRAADEFLFEPEPGVPE